MPMKRRLIASLLDYCVVLAWLAALAAVFVPLHLAGFDPWGDRVDLVSFVASVLPVWLYLTVTEAGARHATWGKRRARLVVRAAGSIAAWDTAAGGSAGAGRIAARNAVKLLPWALAHLGVAPLIAGDGAGALVDPDLAWVPITAAYVLVGLTLALVFIRRDRAALHDLIAGTRVAPAD